MTAGGFASRCFQRFAISRNGPERTGPSSWAEYAARKLTKPLFPGYMASHWPICDLSHRSENRIAAINHDLIAGVKTRCVTGQIDSNTRIFIRLRPAPHRHPADNIIVKFL